MFDLETCVVGAFFALVLVFVLYTWYKIETGPGVKTRTIKILGNTVYKRQWRD